MNILGSRPRSGLFKLALTSLLLVAAGLSPAAAQSAAEGGTMVFAHEQEPGSLNILHPSAGGGAASATGGLFNVGTYRFPPGGEPVPFIIAKEAEITNDPFTVTYTIRDDAVWNDGTPITAADYAFTYETIVNPDWTIANRRPYDLITGYEIISDKVIRFDFSQPYAYYQQMFPLLLPKHDLEGKDWDTAWRDGPGVTNGAFKFEAWEKGQQISFVKNEHYWADGPKLDRIVIRFVPETNTLLELLRSGEIDASDPQPQPQIISAVAGLDGMKVNARSGLVTEFMRFNLKTPGLDKPFVRQAIGMGIDRVALVENLMGPIDRRPSRRRACSSSRPAPTTNRTSRASTTIRPARSRCSSRMAACAVPTRCSSATACGWSSAISAPRATSGGSSPSRSCSRSSPKSASR